MYLSKMSEHILYRSINYSCKEAAIFIPLQHWKNRQEAKELTSKIEVFPSDLRRIRHRFRNLYKNSAANLSFSFLTIENYSLRQTLQFVSGTTLLQHLAWRL